MISKRSIPYQSQISIDFEEIGLYLDYNNSDQNDPSLVKKLSYVNSKSDVPVIKFLGVYIDCNLNFKYHIQAIRKKNFKISLYHAKM